MAIENFGLKCEARAVNMSMGSYGSRYLLIQLNFPVQKGPPRVLGSAAASGAWAGPGTRAPIKPSNVPAHQNDDERPVPLHVTGAHSHYVLVHAESSGLYLKVDTKTPLEQGLWLPDWEKTSIEKSNIQLFTLSSASRSVSDGSSAQNQILPCLVRGSWDFHLRRAPTPASKYQRIQITAPKMEALKAFVLHREALEKHSEGTVLLRIHLAIILFPAGESGQNRFGAGFGKQVALPDQSRANVSAPAASLQNEELLGLSMAEQPGQQEENRRDSFAQNHAGYHPDSNARK
ncbi:hypothetical protein DFH07DRAFT_781271 [Mycena maculata]|uniref:Uncharacterized protein n=1 Tax=Mycena maculata TaxID=230809 RepID=A0AAD7HZ57_9AGAR|nr:hypothetical protein DFH07DRAFT_781271 [Mycena maculata]